MPACLVSKWSDLMKKLSPTEACSSFRSSNQERAPNSFRRPGRIWRMHKMDNKEFQNIRNRKSPPSGTVVGGGVQRKNGTMTYEKIARCLMHYYKQNILQKVVGRQYQYQ